MAKTITNEMRTHLQQSVTSLATAWLITRRDGEEFRFTTASSDKTIDIGDGSGPQVYSATEGYKRSNMQKDTELNVDNADILGIFDNEQITEQDLRSGLFDSADARIFFFNHQDTSTDMGIIKMMRGQFGEVILTTQGFFNVELRDLVQVFTKELGEAYSQDCRADLGDNRCRIPLEPPIISRGLDVNVGEFYRVRTNPAPTWSCFNLVVSFDGADAATTATDFSDEGFTLTFVGDAQLDTAQAKFGTASLLLDGIADRVTVPDDPAWDFADGEFTVEAWVRFNSVGTVQNILRQFPVADRAWRLFFDPASGGSINFNYSTDGSNSINLTGSWAPSVNTWYHVAADRDANDNLRVYIDGVVTVGPTVVSDTFHDSSDVLRIGQTIDGWIDDARITTGKALYGGAFTAPTQANPTSDPDAGITEFPATVFEDRIYEVVIAGTTDADCQPTYDTTIDALTDDGTAQLKAVTSWTRAFTVNTVTEDKRTFTTTELTPNTDFPDDWFAQGAVIFETGENAGRAIEIRNFTADDGVTIVQVVELFEDTPFTIQVGDTGRIQPGCDKRFSTCQTKFMNEKNFVGEPHVPGPDTLGQYPDARS